MEKETNGLCHNIPWLCFWPTNWYRSLPIISDATHKATIASASSTLNPQRVLNKGRRKSGVVALLHPRSAKVRITYCTRMCTDRLHAHISALVSFTKSWLSPRRRAAVGRQTQHLSGMPCGVGLSDPLLLGQHFQVHLKAHVVTILYQPHLISRRSR